jgi:hypothetical protein
MSISEDVRAELAAIEPRRPCCRLAELSALVRGAGTIHLRGAGRITLHLDVASAAIARRAFALLRGYEVASEVRAYRRRAFGRETRYQLHVGDDPRTLQTLEEAGVLDVRLAPLAVVPRRVVGRACCRAAYLRGALLAAGSVSGPRQLHLEIRTASGEAAAAIVAIAAEEGIELHAIERTRHAAAYTKSAEVAADLLALAGAQETALALGEAAVVASTRADANRRANADHANLVRANRAAQDAVRAIRRLERTGALDELPDPLRHAASLRLRYPTLALADLAARCDPPLAKATLHRRLKRLERLAREAGGGARSSI